MGGVARWPYCGFVTNLRLHFERMYEFAPVIVWDALIDADLVSGWLADALIDPRPGGEYTLRWLNRDSASSDAGRIERFEPYSELQVQSTTMGTLRFTLEQRPGGSRGTSTLLSVDITTPVEPAFATRVRANWLTNLDQLAHLLRGHPVDWEHWSRDHAEAWADHLAGAEAEADPAADPAAHGPR